MNTPENTPFTKHAARIDTYLDGTMAAAERNAFERSVASDASLASELELQRRIDTRLGVLMAPPEIAPVAVTPSRPTPESAAPIPITRAARQIPGWMRFAAVLALVTLGIWAALARPWHSLLGPDPSDIAANVTYRELVKGGLKPSWVCESDAVFRKFTKDKFGVPFTVTPAPGLELVGWTYTSGLLESSASVLMCRVDGKPSIVVVGPLADDRRMHADAASGVQIHRKLWSGLVMYEVNERSDAPILDRIKGE